MPPVQKGGSMTLKATGVLGDLRVDPDIRT